MDRVKKIKTLMLLKGIRGVHLAKELGVHPTLIYHVINGRRKSKRVAEYIATRLNIPYRELFGE
ncbi:MAG: helix-turn-helix transcriptional regulator [Nanopusillaceae archaeon]